MEIRSGLELFVIEPFILTELVTVPVILTDRIDPIVTAIRTMDMDTVIARPFRSDSAIHTTVTGPTRTIPTAPTRTATTTATPITTSPVTIPTAMDQS